MTNIGIDSMEVLEANLEIIRNFEPLEESRMQEVRMALQPFYRGGNLAWMQPGYTDGRIGGSFRTGVA
jgi:hypothetical protein